MNTGDPVNHPKHYNDHPSGVECIVIAEHMNFCIGNAFKYLYRAGIKHPEKEAEDLKKAMFYIEYELESRTDIPWRRLKNLLVDETAMTASTGWEAAIAVIKSERRWDSTGLMREALDTLIMASQFPYSIGYLKRARKCVKQMIWLIES